ncbi:MAG: tetratricopeptide repeat protein [Thermoguttaceae bacterium]
MPADHAAKKSSDGIVTTAICAILVAAVFLVFGQTLGHGFINMDDDFYVTRNPMVQRGLSASGTAWAFTATTAANWHPITWLSHMADCQIYGLRPWGHHLTNVLLHAINAVLLFLVFRRMTGAVWPCAMVAIVFAIHPLRAESVAWVSERKDLLSGLFFFLTLWAYVDYAQHRFSWRRYLTVIVLFALGLMSKPMLVTLPCVLLLLDYWPLGRVASGQWPVASDRSKDSNSASGAASCSSLVTDHRPLTTLLLEKLPLFALTLVSCLLTRWAQTEAIVSTATIPLIDRVANALVAYVAYLGQFFYPVGLTVFYPYPSGGLPGWKTFGAMLLLVGVSVAVVVVRRRFPYWLVGWFWYLGMMVPVIGLVQVGSQAMADRYTYLPQIGLSVALVWAAVDWMGVQSGRRRLGVVVAVIVTLELTVCAWQQVSYWRDSRSLWSEALAHTSRNGIAHHHLGLALLDENRNDEAAAEFRSMVKLKPDFDGAHRLLGVALARDGHFQEAVACFQEALRLRPDAIETYDALAWSLACLGRKADAVEAARRAAVLAERRGDVQGAAELRRRWNAYRNDSLPGKSTTSRGESTP